MNILSLSILLLTGLLSAAELPSGQASPEGAACDMGVAFIKADTDLWKKVTMPSTKKDYAEFIQEIAGQMEKQKGLSEDQKAGPKEIGICFKMGKLSKDGPNSYSYAAFGMEEIGFVDVGTVNRDGTRGITRTFVCKIDGKWFALPRPDMFPLLTDGLNDEKRPADIVYKSK